ncbi:PhzF family phenazine biosynthesis isomerase [Bartonella sp. DGB1]|uniref:PhzF family phenazine biosynthesis isomerase n=1 Tax=Bartonella sp. DGB1 TaxID=3239807 RepID=UPI0035243E2F
MSHPIQFFRCFQIPNNPDSGNIAAVVENFSNSLQKRKSLAQELNTPVTVFVDFDTDNKTQISFFYPDRQMPLCIHGALAAGKFLSNMQDNNEVQCLTSNNRKLSFKIDDSSIYLDVEAEEISAPTLNASTLTKMLNFDIKDSDSCSVISVGSPKLLIPINSLNALISLQPNYNFISEWSLEYKINGLYVYTPQTFAPHANYHARAFNPITGHNEDAATGTAAAALSYFLKKSLIIEQGHALQTPCEISTRYTPNQTFAVGGIVKLAR